MRTRSALFIIGNSESSHGASNAPAGYPEGHADSPDKQADVDYLFEKQQAGADFVITQLFYDVDVFMDWYKRCRERGGSSRSLLRPFRS